MHPKRRRFPIAYPPFIVHLGRRNIFVVHRILNLLDGDTGIQGFGNKVALAECGVTFSLNPTWQAYFLNIFRTNLWVSGADLSLRRVPKKNGLSFRSPWPAAVRYRFRAA